MGIDSASRRPERILLVDDEPQVRGLMAMGLRKAGYEVYVAGSAAAAIESAEQLRCGLDLLITDVVMPEITGTELIRRIRSVCPGVEVMAVTGAVEDEQAAAFRNYCILKKPFAPSTLVATVKQILAAHF